MKTGMPWLDSHMACVGEFLTAVRGVGMIIYYMRKNRRRDREYGVPERGVEVDTSLLADEAPTFCDILTI